MRKTICSTERVFANDTELFLFTLLRAYHYERRHPRIAYGACVGCECVLGGSVIFRHTKSRFLQSFVLLFLLAIFCTEPFRIPFASHVDICCFDETGTITAENLVLDGAASLELVSHI